VARLSVVAAPTRAAVAIIDAHCEQVLFLTDRLVVERVLGSRHVEAILVQHCGNSASIAVRPAR
jgi:hypothetical protein